MNKSIMLILNFGFCIVLFFTISCKKQQNNVHRLGFLGMSSYGNPVEKMNNNIIFINSFYKKNKQFPSVELIRKRITTNSNFIFYSYSNTSKCFQISWWSGETSWVYNSKTNIYYETKLDLMNSKWFSVERQKTPEDIKSINLYSKVNRK